ncbi:MAG: alpha-glucosidase [Caulobacteraceae bacterium]|nr:alpha-glucosidase [Caulobacteraceae bacterium]
MGGAGAEGRGEASAAAWWRGAVIYQIYPRSFLDTDGDGVGDLRGVLEKLDYVASLGVDGIWLSPFFRSPMKDFGYDVSDYRDVDPLFGSLADFDTLLAAAHARGLKVIIDQVWSHTSNRHPWFIESAASRDNPRSDWYVWAEAKPDGAPPNNWQATFGGPSWTWNPRRRQYYLHDFLSEQPDLNYWNGEVQDAILDVARFWLERGVDGFRLDVINHLFHDRALRDNPVAAYDGPPATTTQFQRHVHDKSRPEALGFLRRLRTLTDRYDARMMVGEVFDEAALERQQEYTAPPDGLHTAYSFFLLYAPAATPALFAEALIAWAKAPGWPSWSLGNHDVERFASRLARSGDPRQVEILLAVLLCLRGTIFLYQGEELGLPQADVPFEKLRDPFAIAAYTGGSGRDGARTPIPWTPGGPSAGFSTSAETWLPVDPAHRALAVAVQEADPRSMLHFTRRLIALRRSSRVLREGEAVVRETPEGVFGFERRHGDERILCLFDLGGAGGRLPVDPAAELLASFNGGAVGPAGLAMLPAWGGVVLRLSGSAG